MEKTGTYAIKARSIPGIPADTQEIQNIARLIEPKRRAHPRDVLIVKNNISHNRLAYTGGIG